MYAIVDIETTGSFAKGHGITEIAIAIFDGNEIINWYETLINPNAEIPLFITALTNITNEMVADAPTFDEVAAKVYELLKPCIFVAHNVNFDYSFVQKQLQAAGYDWSAKKLCTVRLARKIFPHFTSYKLQSICSELNIEQKTKHRAGADTLATVELFKHLMGNDGEGVIQKLLKGNASEFRLPAHLNREEFDSLPQTTGVYYLLNTKNEVIYVGKANNIKKRVGQHFSGKTDQKTRQSFLREIAHISFEECGNELVALLLEEKEIKKHWPKYNKAQKKMKFAWGLIEYTDRKGHIRLGVDYIRRGAIPLMRFATQIEARHFLLTKTNEYQLCPKLCAIDTSVADSCNTTTTPHCTGSCHRVMAVHEYNTRVQRFINNLVEYKPSYAIITKGRNITEQAVIYISDGALKGFAFIEKSQTWSSKTELENYIQPYKATIDAEMIVSSFLRRNPNANMVVFN